MRTAFVKIGLMLVIFFSAFASLGESGAALEEIAVTGKRPGPPLWSVSHGDHVLWVFATLSPLPKGMDWDDSSVKRILGEAGRLATPPQYSASVSNPLRLFGVMRQFNKLRKLADDQTIDDVMPKEVAERYWSVVEKYDLKHKKLKELRPLFLAEEISKQAYKKLGLEENNKVQKQINKLAKKSDIEIKHSAGEFSIDEALQFLSELSMQDEVNCLDAVLRSLDADVQKTKQRALHWADGESARDIEFTESAVACSDVFAHTPSAADVFQQTEQRWLETNIQGLESHAISFAYLPIAEVVRPDGLLARLKAELATPAK